MLSSFCTSRAAFVVYYISVLKISLLYKCTQNQLTVQVYTKPVDCTIVHKTSWLYKCTQNHFLLPLAASCCLLLPLAASCCLFLPLSTSSCLFLPPHEWTVATFPRQVTRHIAHMTNNNTTRYQAWSPRGFPTSQALTGQATTKTVIDIVLFYISHVVVFQIVHRIHYVLVTPRSSWFWSCLSDYY